MMLVRCVWVSDGYGDRDGDGDWRLVLESGLVMGIGDWVMGKMCTGDWW